MILHVALPLPLNKTFSYSPPDKLPKGELIGRRTLVPLSKKIMTGVIVDTSEEEVGFELKQALEILDDEPAFSSEMLSFTKWISEYYLCSWGETLKAALPQGMSGKSVNLIKLKKIFLDSELEEIEKKNPKLFSLISVLDEHHNFVSVPYITAKIGFSYSAAQLEKWAEEGIIEVISGFTDTVKAKTLKAARIKKEYLKHEEKFREVIENLEKKSPSQALFLSTLYLEQKRKKKPIAIAPLLKKYNLKADAVKPLHKKGFIEIQDIEIDRSEHVNGSLAKKNELNLELNPEQKIAFGKVEPYVSKPEFKAFLLAGATSSGKTLIYIKLIEKLLAQNKSTLILAPEISLTPQLIDRFNRAFPGKVAALNSSMTTGEKFDSWRRIKTGSAKIVLGARSAVFAPLSDIGLIIVDEEHDPGYKQESPAPRYQARDAAVVRAKFLDVPIILGSATPSIESMYNARTGKYELLTLTSRADGAGFPEIRIINMAEERKLNNKGMFSAELKANIIEKLQEDKGIILFQNRRGFSSYLECPDCGAIPFCKNCAVTLTYHKNVNRLKCHYCGYSEAAHKQCQTCGFPEVNLIGAGSQKIEQEVKSEIIELAPYAEVARLDSDSVSKKGAYRRIIVEFATGKTNILVGTQMAAKGLDLERVTLVGVINADLLLFVPDFRAYEKAFQMLVQVAGRSGRTKENPGLVLVQTAHPDNYIIKAATELDYEAFYESEIKSRTEAVYPPFSRFVKIEFAGKEETKVAESATLFAKHLPNNSAPLKIMGPVAPFIPRLKSLYRRLIVIKNIKSLDPSGKILRKHLNYALEKYNEESSSKSVKLLIDIDSYSGL